jgi:hypothetical protein
VSRDVILSEAQLREAINGVRGASHHDLDDPLIAPERLAPSGAKITSIAGRVLAGSSAIIIEDLTVRSTFR